MIAQALRIHETTIVRYIDNYVRDEKLTCDSGGSQGYLSQEQTEQFIDHLCQIRATMAFYFYALNICF